MDGCGGKEWGFKELSSQQKNFHDWLKRVASPPVGGKKATNFPVGRD